MRLRLDGFYWIKRPGDCISVGEYKYAEDDGYVNEFPWRFMGDDGIYLESEIVVISGRLEPPVILLCGKEAIPSSSLKTTE